jgi:hypothetical protein
MHVASGSTNRAWEQKGNQPRHYIMCGRSASHPGWFTLEEKAPGTDWMRGWVAPKAGLDAVEKAKTYLPCRESNPDSMAVLSAVQNWNATHGIINSVFTNPTKNL